MSVARKLIDILKFCGPLSPGEGSEPIGALALQGRPSAIPYFDEILTELGPINGKSIHHCLESIISLCLQTALAFHETLVMSILHSQDQWEKDIRSILSVIERVGSPAANQYFRQKYHL